MLSPRGIENLQNVIELEGILNKMRGIISYYDPKNYTFTFFGEPKLKVKWGFRLEGHHLSANMTMIGNQLVGSTPFFLGANPSNVSVGPNKNHKLLAEEESVARKLIKTINSDQRQKVIFSSEPPWDIILGRKISAAKKLKPLGIKASDLDQKQRQILRELIHVYLINFHADIRAKFERENQMVRTKENWKTCFFAWAGGVDSGKPHYYRIQLPYVIIEYDNTQDNAQHIHTVIRDVRNDFGQFILKNHYSRVH